MTISQLEELIRNNLSNKTDEFKRVFHGRGNFYGDFNYLTVDSINDILYFCLFEEISNTEEVQLFEIFNLIFNDFEFKTLICQRRYIKGAPCEVIKGEIKEDNKAIENGLNYHISFSNRNIGIFPDMKIGREYIQSISKDKKVLNLFSYTCAFSVAAHKGGALKIVNVDMSKGALTQGRKNHHLNNQDTKNVQFMPYNILKSWSRIKKAGPYDIIIIDPPSFQKGSFAATKDYEKIIKKLESLASSNCTVLSCLNAPELNSEFILNIFKDNAPEFKYIKRLENHNTFPSSNEEKSLKNFIFQKNN